MSLGISKVCRGITPSVTLGLNAKVAEMKAAGLNVISLGAGEPDFVTPAHITEAAKEAIDQGRTFYTAANGLPALRKALCDFLKRDKNLSYTPAETIVCTGAKQALLGALIAILNPGDEVLLPAPCWVSYPEMVRMAGGVPVMIDTVREQGFVPTRAQLSSALTPRTRAIILNTPSNPTGAVWTRAQLEDLADFAVKNELYVISDEIYEKLVYDGTEHISIASLGAEIFKQTIMISGFSKAYAMTGWRLGYAAGPRDVIAAMGAYQSHATGNPNSIAQYAAIAALNGDQSCVSDMAAAFARRRALMVERIAEMKNVSCFLPSGAFYVMLDVRPLLEGRFNGQEVGTAHRFAELLLENSLVSAVPCEGFGAPGFCRLSYATSEDNINEAMNRLEDFIAQIEINTAA